MSRGRNDGSKIGLRGGFANQYANAIDSAVDIIGDLDLKNAEAFAKGRPLRIKIGFDPTAPDIHLGHTVLLRRARAFQDAGAQVVLIIGDYTARVGDPTGKNALRPQLDPETIRENAQTYQDQALKILDKDRLEVRYNSEWLDKMSPSDMMSLLAQSTVAQMLERADFAARYQNNQPISLLEFAYPLLQGHDSVAIDADIELGGTDQLYNLHMGRGMHSQCLITYPLLVGIDGQKKMSKSLGNYIGVQMDPIEMYGRTMRIPDEALAQYWQLLFGQDRADKEVSVGGNPMHSKRRLAEELISLYHGPEDAQRAREVFDSRHVRGSETQEDLRLVQVPSGQEVDLPALLKETFNLKSRSEGKRMIQGGAVRINGEKVLDEKLDTSALTGATLQMGKRNRVRFS
jgi:tyrosyl-tRNA synthetase